MTVVASTYNRSAEEGYLEISILERQPGPDLSSLTFNVSMPPERANDLTELLNSIGIDFDPHNNVTVFNDDPHYQCRFTGADVHWLIEDINTYLFSRSLRPFIPTNHQDWTLERRYALLKLASTEFNWSGQFPAPPWWMEHINQMRWNRVWRDFAIVFEEPR